MISIAICDDEPKEIQRANNFITRYIEKHPQYEITSVSFIAPLELLSHVEEHGSFDIFLLDIYMDGMLGTVAARQLRDLGAKGDVIFLTTSKDHALDAFEVDAAQYLIKPYTEDKLFLALDKLVSRSKLEQGHNITLKTSEGILRIFTRDVVFTETGKNNYQIIHTISGKKIEVRMTALELFELLAQTKSFVRCGVSINLNLKFIRQIKKDMIIFDSGDTLNYPYRAYKKIKEDFLNFEMSRDE